MLHLAAAESRTPSSSMMQRWSQSCSQFAADKIFSKFFFSSSEKENLKRKTDRTPGPNTGRVFIFQPLFKGASITERRLIAGREFNTGNTVKELYNSA